MHCATIKITVSCFFIVTDAAVASDNDIGGELGISNVMAQLRL